MKLVIKLFPEITIKSAPVRRKQIRQLRHNIHAVCRPLDDRLALTGQWDHLELNASLTDPQEQDALIQRLMCISGIHQILQVQEYPLDTLDAMLAQVHCAFGQRLPGKTFCIRVKRAGSHPFSSPDVERFLGAGLLRLVADCRVNLTAPDIKISIEIRHDRWHLVHSRHQGAGGYPMGTQQPVLSLVSGGYDSAVASYLTMRRGLKTHFCFFDLGGHGHEKAVKELACYLWSRYGAAHQADFVTIPFTDVVKEIVTRVENRYRGVVLKRMMLRAASRIAERMQISTLVTGEAIAQVASQTLPNLAVIDAVTDKLVLRPLITMDKQEIIALAERIGTAEQSRRIPEYCGAISDKSSAWVQSKNLEREESFFEFSSLERAMDSARHICISSPAVEQEDAADKPVDVVHVADPDQVIIDIRHPGERRPGRLERVSCAVLNIPFYELASRFADMDGTCQYLLYCDKGLMSHMQALHLRDAGHTNVRVFQPAS
ncbi:MAG: tRNA 4-thiouridine(8) synthase ThiI [Kistimonas sp.]|nr:tRNA 4-thiouridine(8) synthase ThiI [Kistimonas sp.]